MIIEYFSGEYRFLSNFYPVLIRLPDGDYPSVEHAYQASKTEHPGQRAIIRGLRTPGEAKRFGRGVDIVPNWDIIKLSTMEELLRLKFAQPSLRHRLFATGSQELIEGNHWGDTFWGVYNGQGQNQLGKLLMKIRSELSSQCS